MRKGVKLVRIPVAQIIETMRENPGLCVVDLCSLACVDPGTFYRRLKQSRELADAYVEYREELKSRRKGSRYAVRSFYAAQLAKAGFSPERIKHYMTLQRWRSGNV